MKSPEDVRREFVKQWLTKADEDFNLAKELVAHDSPYCSAIGFHAQQAVEKWLKAVLVHHQVEFRKTHDLDELVELITKVNNGLAEALREVSILTPYGVEARYPGDLPMLSKAEAKAAVELAEKVREAVQKALKIS